MSPAQEVCVDASVAVKAVQETAWTRAHPAGRRGPPQHVAPARNVGRGAGPEKGEGRRPPGPPRRRRRCPWTIRGERQPSRIGRTRTRWWGIPGACVASTNGISRRESVEAAEHPGQAGRIHQRQRGDYVAHARPHRRPQGNSEHNTRKRRHAIPHPHDQRIQTTHVARGRGVPDMCRFRP